MMGKKSLLQNGILLAAVALSSLSSKMMAAEADASNNAVAVKVVGGNDAPKGKYPYYVKMTDIGCGAALVSSSAVLTAAHCGNQKGKQLIVDALFYDDNKSIKEGGERRTCVEYVADPTYDDKGDGLFNDFSLCRLNKPVTNKSVLQINSNPNWPPPSTDLTVIGLGVLRENGYTPSRLQQVQVPLVSTQDCKAAYGNGAIRQAENICAGKENKDSCQGDSGGPLIYRRNNQDYHVGTVSWGNGCADRRYPGVYSRTSFRFNWIKSIVCDRFNDKDATLCDGNDNGPQTGDDDDDDDNDNGCDGKGGKLLSVKLVTDKYPGETSYTVSDSNTGSSLLDGKNFDKQFKLYQESKCIEAGTCFGFEIKDDYGDGLTEGKEGSYELSLDGTVIKSGKNFGDIDTHNACIEGNDNQDNNVPNDDRPTDDDNDDAMFQNDDRPFDDYFYNNDDDNDDNGPNDDSPFDDYYYQDYYDDFFGFKKQTTAEPTPMPTPPPTPDPTPQPTPPPTLKPKNCKNKKKGLFKVKGLKKKWTCKKIKKKKKCNFKEKKNGQLLSSICGFSCKNCN